MAAGAPDALPRLRRMVAGIEGQETCLEAERRLAFGVATLDAALGGGLACGALHEVTPVTVRDLGAASGFMLALAARACGEAGETMLIQQHRAGGEAGLFYAPGLDQFGLPSARVLLLRLPQATDMLWALEEALKSRALCAVIGELAGEGQAADLNATRRLALAARESGTPGLLLRHRFAGISSAAATRWRIAALPAQPDFRGGIGQTRLHLSLLKNRRGPCGEWTLVWNHHDRIFAPLSVDLAAPVFDRPARAPLARAG